MQFKISLVITSFNYSNYIEGSIKSALTQTRYPDEIIIIDDASSDGSQKLIQKYEKHQNVKCIYRKKNQGILANINEALNNASGDYIFFLAADDFIEKDIIKVYESHLIQNPNVGFCCSMTNKLIAETNKIISAPHQANFPEGYISSTHAKSLIYKHGAWFCGNTILLNRKNALEAGGFDPLLYSYTDGFLYLTLALKYGLININKALSTYRSSNNTYSSQIWTNPERLLQIERRVLDIMLNSKELFDEKFQSRWQSRWKYMSKLSNLFINNKVSNLTKIFVSIYSFLLYRWFDILNIRLIDIHSFYRKLVNAND